MSALLVILATWGEASFTESQARKAFKPRARFRKPARMGRWDYAEGIDGARAFNAERINITGIIR